MNLVSYPTYNQAQNKKSLNFTSIYYKYNTYRDSMGVKHETQNSTCKRNDLNYQKLSKIIQLRFKDYDRVNIMPMNVSDGTEAYYISQPLIEDVGMEEFERKYSPIIATDVCEDIIESYPKRGLVQLFKGEPEELYVLREPMFNEVPGDESYRLMGCELENKLYKLKPEYRKLFKFGTQDFQDRISKLNDEGNSVVIIRNCLRQSFGDMKSAIIVSKLAQKLNGESLLITGNYDRGMPLFESALDDYFVEIDSNIWAKKDYNENKEKEVSEQKKIDDDTIEHIKTHNSLWNIFSRLKNPKSY